VWSKFPGARNGVIFVASLLLSACATRDASKVSFPDPSQMSLLVIRVEPAQIDYALNLARFDPARKTVDPVFGSVSFTVIDPRQARYLALAVRPGTYVFQELVQQDIWGVCFNNDTRAFTVRRNEAVFLGDFNPTMNLKQIEKLASEHGDQTWRLGGMPPLYSDVGIIQPQISTPRLDSADFLAAKQYEASTMPSLHERLQPVQYTSATYERKISCIN
jgi:hypothetical protein